MRFLSVLYLVALTYVTPAFSTENVGWYTLIDQNAQVYEDPYLDLTYDQLDDLRTVALAKARIEEGGLSAEERAELISNRDEANSRLAQSGIDADWLIDQRWVVAERREKAATAVNPEMDGRNVVLSGFAIPGPPESDGTSVVYLVPERGMCSHVPPPNPNQMIRARLKENWSPRMMHEPVRLTGVLSAQETQHVFRIVDGNVPMHASFVMEVELVETVEDLRGSSSTTEEWAAGIAERLRASGHLPSKESDAQK